MQSLDHDSDLFFEELSELYQTDPEKFEEQRRILIERTISEFPRECRERAQGLQFTIDARLHRYKDPIMRMNKMVEIFWEHFARFQETVNDPERILEERQHARRQAKILPFRPSSAEEPSNKPN